MDDILIVKLGGSCASSPDFARWIQAIEKSSIPIVIVPGGGPFANTVRRYQPRLGYDDEAAHHMAILAMEQFGWALVSLGTRMTAATSRQDIDAVLESGRIAVWMPGGAVLDAPDIARNWSVTSDSLAAWLAGSIANARLLLVKQIDVPMGSSIAALIGAGIVDEAFAGVVHPATRVHVAGPADLAMARRRFAGGVVPGHEVAGRYQILDAAQ